MSLDLLLVGAGRSGTNLLVGCLNAHPELLMLNEVGSIEYLFGKAFLGQPQEAELCSIDNMIDRFLQASGEATSGRTERFVGNKITSEHLMGLHKHNHFHPQQPVDVERHFLNHRMANSKVVFIFRNGRNCIASKMKRRSAEADEAAGRWNYVVDAYKKVVDQRDNLYALKYEDLVNKPELTLANLCDFLGLAYDPIMLSGPENSAVIDLYRRQGFDARAANQTMEIPASAEALIAENMAYLGYA